MANSKQLEILRAGAEDWNKWRKEQPSDIRIDLVEANLSGAELRGVLSARGADLHKADLNQAKLRGANLALANLSLANFSLAELNAADLSATNLYGTNLSGANLDEADLGIANVNKTHLKGAKFTDTKIGITTFGTTDLSEIDDLETAMHLLPSTIGTDTLQLSKGKIPEAFLRGCGLVIGISSTQNLPIPTSLTKRSSRSNIASMIYALRKPYRSLRYSSPIPMRTLPL